jgi:hypothetical protein
MEIVRHEIQRAMSKLNGKVSRRGWNNKSKW